MIVSQLKAKKEPLLYGTVYPIAELRAFSKQSKSISKPTDFWYFQLGCSKPQTTGNSQDQLRKKRGIEITDFSVRDASGIGWHRHEEFYVTKMEKIFWQRIHHTILPLYFMRGGCFVCSFSNLKRPFDS